MLDWFKRKPEQAKESRTGQVMFTGKNQASWSLGNDKTNAKQYAAEGYQKNVVAFQAINKTADAVAAMKWIARDARGNEVEVSALLDLIRQPNPLQSGPEFMRALVGYFRISGNGYMEKVMVGQQPRELYTLRPDRMEVKPSSTGFPAGYCFSVGQAKVEFEANPRTGQSDIRHMKSFNPLDDWYGMSPLMAGAYAIDQHNEAMQWMQALLQNGAAPSGAMELAEGSLSDDQFNRLKSEIDEKYTGSTNAGRPMLLEGGLKWTQMGLSPVDVAIIETKYSAARDVSLALGVPPLLLNIPGDSTYSNYKEARLAFYEENVIPLAMYIRDELNAWLSPLFNNVTLDIDLDKIPAIAEKRLELWMMADKSTDLTINETREIKGYDPLPTSGDQILVQSSMIPLTMAVEPISLPGEGDLPTGETDLGTPAGAKVQELALNGAQIGSIADIVLSVSTGQLPGVSAINLLRVAFPTIDQATAEAIINHAASFKPEDLSAMKLHIIETVEKQATIKAAEVAYGQKTT